MIKGLRFLDLSYSIYYIDEFVAIFLNYILNSVDIDYVESYSNNQGVAIKKIV